MTDRRRAVGGSVSSDDVTEIEERREREPTERWRMSPQRERGTRKESEGKYIGKGRTWKARRLSRLSRWQSSRSAMSFLYLPCPAAEFFSRKDQPSVTLRHVATFRRRRRKLERRPSCNVLLQTRSVSAVLSETYSVSTNCVNLFATSISFI